MKDELPELTRKSTLEALFKARTDLRIGNDALDTCLTGFNTLGSKIVSMAVANAKLEQRTTLMAKDALTAFQSIQSGNNLDDLFPQLEKLSAKDTADLAQRIKEWLEQH